MAKKKKNYKLTPDQNKMVDKQLKSGELTFSKLVEKVLTTKVPDKKQ